MTIAVDRHLAGHTAVVDLQLGDLHRLVQREVCRRFRLSGQLYTRKQGKNHCKADQIGPETFQTISYLHPNCSFQKHRRPNAPCSGPPCFIILIFFPYCTAARAVNPLLPADFKLERFGLVARRVDRLDLIDARFGKLAAVFVLRHKRAVYIVVHAPVRRHGHVVPCYAV